MSNSQNSKEMHEKEMLLMEYRLLENFINHMPKTYRKRHRNWVIVQQFLQRGTSFAGSTSSNNKCVKLGIDPDGYEIKNFHDAKKEWQNEGKLF